MNSANSASPRCTRPEPATEDMEELTQRVIREAFHAGIAVGLAVGIATALLAAMLISKLNP